MGECEGNKKWPLDKQLVMDWRMPTDATRVILFERIGYEMNKIIDEEDRADSQSCLDTIKQIKELYPKKLS
jgi:hypothetical protein